MRIGPLSCVARSISSRLVSRRLVLWVVLLDASVVSPIRCISPTALLPKNGSKSPTVMEHFEVCHGVALGLTGQAEHVDSTCRRQG